MSIKERECGLTAWSTLTMEQSTWGPLSLAQGGELGVSSIFRPSAVAIQLYAVRLRYVRSENCFTLRLAMFTARSTILSLW